MTTPAGTTETERADEAVLADETVLADDLGCLGPDESACTPGRRRRGEALEQAILTAALDQLAAHGLGELTMEGIAAAAQTGKASVYRRWPAKEDLVLDALARAMPQVEDVVDSTGSIREDLRIVLGRMAAFVSGPHGSVVRSLIGTVDPFNSLLTALRVKLIEPRLIRIRALIDQAVERGEIPPVDAGTAVAQVGPAVLIHRYLLYGRITEADVTEVLDQVVLPLLSAGRRDS